MIRSIAALTMVALFAPAACAEFVWVGSAGGFGGDDVSLFQEANWEDTNNPGNPPLTGSINGNANVLDHLVVHSGMPGGTGGAAPNLQLGSLSLTMTGGTLRMRDDSGIRNGTVSITGGELITRFFASTTTSDGTDVSLGGEGLITLIGGANPLNHGSTIDLLGSDGTIHFLDETPGAVQGEHLTKLTVGGAPAVVGSVLDVIEPGDNMLITTDGSIGAFVAAAPVFNLLTLEVNITTGHVKMMNASGTDVELDFYKITSGSGSLEPAGWTSLFDQDLPGFPAGDGTGNGWEEAGGSNDKELGEVFLLGSSTLADQAKIGLGALFDDDAGQQDLGFTYHDADTDALLNAQVVYVSGTFAADFDEDGDVDGDDFLTWQGGFGIPSGAQKSDGDADGDGDVDGDDFLLWQDQFGSTPGAAAASSAVPEPATVILAAALLSICTRRFFARSTQDAAVP